MTLKEKSASVNWGIYLKEKTVRKINKKHVKEKRIKFKKKSRLEEFRIRSSEGIKKYITLIFIALDYPVWHKYHIRLPDIKTLAEEYIDIFK